MTRRRLSAAITLAGIAAALCSCGSSPSGPTPTPTAAALDSCLVGTWKSAAISGGITVGGALVSLTGGQGELLTITAAGSVRTDDSRTVALTGTASDGTAYRLVQSGTATGTISGSGGHIVVKLDQPTPLTVTLYKNGTVLQSQHPGSATDSYTCSAGVSLVITGGGGTVITYQPG